MIKMMIKSKSAAACCLLLLAFSIISHDESRRTEVGRGVIPSQPIERWEFSSRTNSIRILILFPLLIPPLASSLISLISSTPVSPTLYLHLLTHPPPLSLIRSSPFSLKILCWKLKCRSSVVCPSHEHVTTCECFRPSPSLPPPPSSVNRVMHKVHTIKAKVERRAEVAHLYSLD